MNTTNTTNTKRDNTRFVITGRSPVMTKYIGPTDSRGSRVKAWCYAGSVVLSLDHGLSTDQNRMRACQALLAKLGWDGEAYGDSWHGVYIDGNICVFVPVFDER